ncbi:ATP synthase subunit I [Paenibacillus psychroresistens]|uniref:ATP synthase subunit I n=1 Tax=Paenibacillus psychroresistens TaxID=1778678 RepID=A0A6B8RDA4_9BACL|nr:ATP synthase subunit I [Paenibacillus psychroresistens]QGQ93472.1 ATP synthase subunit I [Paenibacillus psychroresistens]
MNDITALQKTVTRITFCFLSICFLGWAFLPQYAGYLSGLVIGSSASLISFNFLAWKIRRLTDKLLLQNKRRVNIGFFTRAAVALLAVVISLRYEQVELVATVVGLFFAQTAAFVVGIISSRKNGNNG